MKISSISKALRLATASALIIPCALWAKEPQDSLILPTVPVYLTKDVSATGLKKLYRKVAPSDSKPYIHEYAADLFLRNGDDSILEHDNESPNAILPDLPREFAQALSTDSNLRFRATTNKNSPVTGWHNFRFWPCLCYDEALRENMLDEQCQAQTWYPSSACRLALKALHIYKQNITTPRMVVVLSKFKPQAGAAVENMLSGNLPTRIAATHPYQAYNILPLVDFWARRIANPDKQTVFITVLTDIEDSTGKKHNLGIIGSTSFIAAQKAAFELAHQVNPAIQWAPDATATANQEQEGSRLLQRMIGTYIPESVYDKYDKLKENKRKHKTKRLIEERNNDSYKIIHLDK